MVFSNLTFLYLFLPLNLLLYFIGKNTTWRNGVLTAFSLFFYAWGEPVFVLLLLFSAAANYGFGLAIARYKGDSPKCRLLLASSVAVNLGLLAFFKYSAFLVANLNALLGTSIPAPAVALPIGISFYTFQILSYVIDVYRGEVAAQRSFLKLLMYVSMYPQLVAGPIVRYSHIAEEIENRAVTWDSFSRGITRFCFGLFKKVVVANYAGQLASSYLDGDLSQLSTPGAWLGLLLFTLQIYYDFSAYSDMAIGLGQMFGFHYRENFDYPHILLGHRILAALAYFAGQFFSGLSLYSIGRQPLPPAAQPVDCLVFHRFVARSQLEFYPLGPLLRLFHRFRAVCLGRTAQTPAPRRFLGIQHVSGHAGLGPVLFYRPWSFGYLFQGALCRCRHRSAGTGRGGNEQYPVADPGHDLLHAGYPAVQPSGSPGFPQMGRRAAGMGPDCG